MIRVAQDDGEKRPKRHVSKAVAFMFVSGFLLVPGLCIGLQVAQVITTDVGVAILGYLSLGLLAAAVVIGVVQDIQARKRDR